MMTREEYLDWCKQRALKYLETRDFTNAINSMFSDLEKHEKTRGHPALELGMRLLVAGHLEGSEEARKFIEGFA